MVATMALSSAACSNSKTEGKPEAQAKVAPVEKNGDKTVIRFGMRWVEKHKGY